MATEHIPATPMGCGATWSQSTAAGALRTWSCHHPSCDGVHHYWRVQGDG